MTNILGRKSILVVDDYAGCRLAVVTILKDYGYDVDAAQNGHEALNFMKNKRYDLVITDLDMPGISGIDLLRNIKAIAPDTNVIIATGSGTVNSYMESMILGACEYLTEPIEMKKLAKTVANAFSQDKHPRLAA
jgi:two-component system NtrC family response regulator/two-component system response regulator HydG/two-component system response regulator AtoC